MSKKTIAVDVWVIHVGPRRWIGTATIDGRRRKIERSGTELYTLYADLTCAVHEEIEDLPRYEGVPFLFQYAAECRRDNCRAHKTGFFTTSMSRD